MVSELHLFTVGVSILQNFGRSDVGKEFSGSDGWYRLPPDSPEQQKFISWARRGERVFDTVLRFVDSDPRRASAELNAFYRFESLAGAAEREVALLATDTGTGLFCARVLEAHLESRGYRVREPIVVRGFGLGYDFFEDALASLMDTIAKTVGKRGDRVYLNATGGFKPETTFAVIAALLHGVRGIYYIHESFQDVVILPAPPLQIEASYLEKLRMLGAEGKQKYLLLDAFGWSEPFISELADRQLVELKSGKVIPRRWIRPLL
ncbi:MAG: putative CRISPR-associated protein [Thaumarchaeota archaeon]|nr:putative CRISPR-associated protein [Nitrososphaerota archaeon]